MHTIHVCNCNHFSLREREREGWEGSANENGLRLKKSLISICEKRASGSERAYVCVCTKVRQVHV